MAGEMAAANNNGDVRTGSEEKKKDAAGSSSSRMLVVVFVALLIDLLAFTMILPLLPALLDYYGHNDKVCFRVKETSLQNHDIYLDKKM